MATKVSVDDSQSNAIGIDFIATSAVLSLIEGTLKKNVNTISPFWNYIPFHHATSSASYWSPHYTPAVWPCLLVSLSLDDTRVFSFEILHFYKQKIDRFYDILSFNLGIIKRLNQYTYFQQTSYNKVIVLKIVKHLVTLIFDMKFGLPCHFGEDASYRLQLYWILSTCKHGVVQTCNSLPHWCWVWLWAHDKSNAVLAFNLTFSCSPDLVECLMHSEFSHWSLFTWTGR